jgi:signal transduction histidine kinase
MSEDLDPAGLAEYLAGRVKWIAVAVFAAVITVGALGFTPVHPSPLVTAAGAVAAVGAATLLVLRQRPAWPYAAVATAGIAALADGQSSNIAWFAVCLLAGACVLASRREGLAFWAGTMILFVAEWLWGRPDPGWGAWLAGVTLTAGFSLLIRHDRHLLAQLRQAQAGLAEQARTQERNHIARELHDIIGHTLTVSLLHVQSARLAVEHDPSDAARALAEAERLGRECLAEVRMTVGMLRQDGDHPDAGIAPLPGMDGLPALVGRFRSAGADVTLTVEGDEGDEGGGGGGLPATTGLAVYRILQEVLTNAVKHAPGAPTMIRLAIGGGTVTLTADSAAEPGTGTGLGVISMRERAESVGGSCEAGPGGHGWLVRATLPLGAGLRTAKGGAS